MEIIMALNSGGWCLRSDDGQLIRTLDEPAEIFIRKPHMLQITRDIALQQLGTWTWHFFQYRRPVLGLARSEQRLLVLAAQGGTDVELAAELRISLSAVKKTWSSIYRRVAVNDFDLFPREEPDRGGDAQTDRGREKKHKLIAYTREHPEELRPHVPRLVDEAPDPTPADYRPRPSQPKSSLQQTPSIHPEPSKRSRAS
jgi:DNA-binding CsgD family transcriptional regulator